MARLHVNGMSIPRYLLASDLDGTLIPLDTSAQRLHEVAEFARLARDCPDLLLAYVTGRHFALAQAGVREFGLPRPHFMACDVGTSLYRLVGDELRLDEDYRSAMRGAFGEHTGQDVKEALASIRELQLQEAEKQAEFKVSYYTSDSPDTILSQVSGRLDEEGVTANLVASYDTVSERGLVDVLPQGVAKDYAVRYLHDHSGVDEEHLIYAGDSGNDRAAMLAGYRVIVVANADESFKTDLRREAADRKIGDHIYFARHPYARGVVKGCQFFGLFSTAS